MTEQIIGILALAAGPLTSIEVHQALRRSGSKFQLHEVTDKLRALQRNETVTYDGVRWRLLRPPPPLPRLPRAATPFITPSALPSKTKVQPPFEGEVRSPTGRWDLFRRLCRYYLDCLVQDEAPQLRVYLDNQNDTWISLGQINWARLAETPYGFSVALTKEQAPFQRNRARRGPDECIFLCYPVSFVRPDGKSGFLVPIFVQPMQASWSGGTLNLQPDGPITVNGAWLEGRFRQHQERDAFLRSMGFLSASTDEDEDTAASPVVLDFIKLAQDAAAYLHDAKRFSERINPYALNPIPTWDNAIPGLYNQALLALGPRLRYTRGLCRDLKQIAEKFTDEDLDSCALTHLFLHDGLSESGSIQKPPTFTPHEIVQTRFLSPCQRDAVTNALNAHTSVVTGPPGTGKSEVATAILINQLLRGQPTLFASKNHQALEAVVPRLNGIVAGDGLIIQASARELAQKQNYLQKLQSLLVRPSRADGGKVDKLVLQLHEAFIRQSDILGQIQCIRGAANDYAMLLKQLRAQTDQLPIHLRSPETLNTWPAITTIEQVEGFEAELAQCLKIPDGLVSKIVRWLRRKEMRNRLSICLDKLLKHPNPFVHRPYPDACADLADWNEFFIAWKTWAGVKRIACDTSNCEERLRNLPSQEEFASELARVQQSIEELTHEWLELVAGGTAQTLTPEEREVLTNLRAGIQNWGLVRFGKELKKNFSPVIRAFPLWSVSNLAARSALPLVPGMFDLLIVDEASQCDIPSVIPLLARSRRAVMIGDPMQLRHITNLDRSVDQILLQQYQLTEAKVQRFTYRVNSCFELADSNKQLDEANRVRLDSHFRSHPEIAGYCNEAFYEKTLQIVTATERLRIPKGSLPGIHWTQIAGQLETGQTGAFCLAEVEAIHAEILKLVAQDYRGTIGVVTPFKQQMIRLKDNLENSDSLPREFLERTQFLIATAHGFQGSERDLLFFSLCGGSDLPAGSTIFLRENPNLFNVAVSRARAVLHVVGNRDWALNSGVSYIEKLARRTLPKSKEPESGHADLYQSPWEKILADALREAGVEVVPQYPIAGRFLDLAVLSPIKLDIEVDGESVHRTESGNRKDDDYWRDLQLRSLGWQVCRFWVYELREDLPKCVAKVLKSFVQ